MRRDSLLVGISGGGSDEPVEVLVDDVELGDGSLFHFRGVESGVVDSFGEVFSFFVGAADDDASLFLSGDGVPCAGLLALHGPAVGQPTTNEVPELWSPSRIFFRWKHSAHAVVLVKVRDLLPSSVSEDSIVGSSFVVPLPSLSSDEEGVFVGGDEAGDSSGFEAAQRCIVSPHGSRDRAPPTSVGKDVVSNLHRFDWNVSSSGEDHRSRRKARESGRDEIHLVTPVHCW